MSDTCWKKELVQGICVVLLAGILGSCLYFDEQNYREAEIKRMEIKLEIQKLEKEQVMSGVN